MLRKKGTVLLPEFVIKIVIALLCLFVLFLLLKELTGIFIEKSEKERAEAQLGNIIEIANNLGVEEIGSKEQYEITNPKNWYLMGFSESLELTRKDICFCPEAYEGMENDIYGKCSKKGVCKKADFPVLLNSIKIEKLKRIYFTKEKTENLPYVDIKKYNEIITIRDYET